MEEWGCPTPRIDEELLHPPRVRQCGGGLSNAPPGRPPALGTLPPLGLEDFLEPKEGLILMPPRIYRKKRSKKILESRSWYSRRGWSSPTPLTLTVILAIILNYLFANVIINHTQSRCQEFSPMGGQSILAKLSSYVVIKETSSPDRSPAESSYHVCRVTLYTIGRGLVLTYKRAEEGESYSR